MRGRERERFLPGGPVDDELAVLHHVAGPVHAEHRDDLPAAAVDGRETSLGERPEIVVMSKGELPGAAEIRAEFAREIGREVIGVSAVTGQGLDALLRAVVEELDRRKEPA